MGASLVFDLPFLFFLTIESLFGEKGKIVICWSRNRKIYCSGLLPNVIYDPKGGGRWNPTAVEKNDLSAAAPPTTRAMLTTSLYKKGHKACLVKMLDNLMNIQCFFFFIESRIWRVFLVAKNHRDFDSTKNHTILKVKFLSKNSNWQNPNIFTSFSPK